MQLIRFKDSKTEDSISYYFYQGKSISVINGL